MRTQRRLSQNTFETLHNLIQMMRDENKSIPILVEGLHDREALRLIGFEGDIIIMNQGLSLERLAEKISRRYSRVIIFLDWDPKGEELTKRMSMLLTSNGVRCNLELRRKISSLLSPQISSVEQLSTMV